MKIVARLLALFISVSAQSSWGVMRLSQDQQGEVLIYPFYSALSGDFTELKVSNTSGFVKGVKVKVREGLRGDVGLAWNVYLGPYDDFIFHIWKNPSGDGAVIKPASSESTCTVPSFDGYEQGVYMRNFEWQGDSFSGVKRSLAGYVEVFELGQWDPFIGNKGPAAARGAAGSTADCEVLIDAWSIISGLDGDWLADKTSEALSWRGGALSGSASLSISSQLLEYDALALEGFSRYQLAAEYHEPPGERSTSWPGANLNGASTIFEQVINGVTVRQSAEQGRDAVSALLASTVLQSQAPASPSSTQSWVLSFPTKHLHTELSSQLGPFSEVWNASLSQSCDFVEVGSYMSMTAEFEAAGETQLCAAVNLLNTLSAGEPPVSFPDWLTTSPLPELTISPTALRAAYRGSASAEADRSIAVDSNYDSDTRIFGLPMVAIPIYYDGSGQVQSDSFDSTTTRIYERLTTSFQQAAYSSNTATIQLGVSNLSGFDVTSYTVACEGETDVIKASSTTASVTVTPLVAGERYFCSAVAHTATGQGKTSDAFLIQIALTPAPPEAPTISLGARTANSAQINFSSNGEGSDPITSYSASCEIPSLAPSESLPRGQTRPIPLGWPTQHRLTRKNAQGLDAAVGWIYSPSPELTFAAIGDLLEFETPTGAREQAQITRAEVTQFGNYLVQAKSPNSEILAVVTEDGNFISRVIGSAGVFQSQILEGRSVVYSEADGELVDNPFINDTLFHDFPGSQDRGIEPSELSANPTVISVGIQYDNATRDAYNEIALAEYYVEVANQSYQASDVDIRFEIVGTRNYEPYISYSTLSETLRYITCGTTACNPGDSYNSNVKTWRDQVKADLVVQLVRYGVTFEGQGTQCGVGWSPTTSAQFQLYLPLIAFSVNAVESRLGYACNDITVAHEMGHNFGLFHDRGTAAGSSGRPYFSYAYGYRIDSTYGTVMSYSPQYVYGLSTPYKTFNGVPGGVPIGQDGEAYAAQAVANVMHLHENIYNNPTGTYHTVGASAGDGGVISPTSASVQEGSTVSFTVTPNSDYSIASVTGCNGSLAGSTYTTGAITGPCTVTANFQKYRWGQTTSGNSLTLTDLPTGYQFICRGFATNLAGDSALSSPISFVTQTPTAPSRPLILQTEVGDGEVYLSVSAPSDGGSAVTRYSAACTDGASTYTGTSTSSPVTVSGLTNGVAYTCTVTATNSVGTSSASAATAPITPEESISGLPIWLLYQVSALSRDDDGEVTTFIVTASAGTGGLISPSGAQTVTEDGTVSFTLAADSGYSFSTISGTCPFGRVSGTSYTTGAITQNCTVVAEFTSINTAGYCAGTPTGVICDPNADGRSNPGGTMDSWSGEDWGFENTPIPNGKVVAYPFLANAGAGNGEGIMEFWNNMPDLTSSDYLWKGWFSETPGGAVLNNNDSYCRKYSANPNPQQITWSQSATPNRFSCNLGQSERVLYFNMEIGCYEEVLATVPIDERNCTVGAPFQGVGGYSNYYIFVQPQR